MSQLHVSYLHTVCEQNQCLSYMCLTCTLCVKKINVSVICVLLAHCV